MTETALRLLRDGVIRCGRGHLSALERRSCECYAVVTNVTERLLYEPMAA